jgi:hypothetical protein
MVGYLLLHEGQVAGPSHFRGGLLTTARGGFPGYSSTFVNHCFATPLRWISTDGRKDAVVTFWSVFH